VLEEEIVDALKHEIEAWISESREPALV
jgi:hypothetical protein